MNKISDLKVGDQVITNFYGKGIVYEIEDKWVILKDIEVKMTCVPYFANWEIDWQKANELNNKQMKDFIIECPSGFEVDKEKSTFEKIVFKEIENKLPISFEEIKGINRRWYIGEKGEIFQKSIHLKEINQLSSPDRARAFLALMQLVELRDAWNCDWKADYNNGSQPKYCVMIEKGLITRGTYPLHFKSEQLRDQFAEQFKDLIETAKELL